MDLTRLTDYINNLNRTAQTRSNAARVPGSTGLETRSSANIGNELRGQVPPDVLRLLQQQGAERGVATGTAGSSNNDAAYLQALGLTSIGLQEQGQRDLSAADARNPGAPLFDPSTQVMTPYQSANLDLERQRLALEAATRGGGGGGGGGYGRGGASPAAPGMPDEFALGYNGPGGGATGSVLGGLAPDFGQQQWWSSIGYGNQGAPASTSGTGTEMNPGSIDWSSLFGTNTNTGADALYRGTGE
jgi:hypothetical protein